MDKAFGAPRIARITAVALVAVLGGGGSVGPAEPTAVGCRDAIGIQGTHR